MVSGLSQNKSNSRKLSRCVGIEGIESFGASNHLPLSRRCRWIRMNNCPTIADLLGWRDFLCLDNIYNHPFTGFYTSGSRSRHKSGQCRADRRGKHKTASDLRPPIPTNQPTNHVRPVRARGPPRDVRNNEETGDFLLQGRGLPQSELPSAAGGAW